MNGIQMVSLATLGSGMFSSLISVILLANTRLFSSSLFSQPYQLLVRTRLPQPLPGTMITFIGGTFKATIRTREKQAIMQIVMIVADDITMTFYTTR
mmetsp:Transcript_35290/g.55455  ORF Transcript_35290/g.55455 Transcript_35290/m.55455 type:complete len:97 (+) Transcript_35290:717-1007(+)